MRTKLHRRSRLAVAALLLSTLVACGEPVEDEDCDAEDLRHREPECGYYDPNGAFVVYPWIVPGAGGHPPKGSHPKPPPGLKQPAKPAVNKPAPAKPAPAKPAAPRGGGRR